MVEASTLSSVNGQSITKRSQCRTRCRAVETKLKLLTELNVEFTITKLMSFINKANMTYLMAQETKLSPIDLFKRKFVPWQN
jgi:hypothetical protein